MKNCTALKRSKSSVRFQMIMVPSMWALFVWLRWWQIAAIASFMSLYLLMELWNIRRINRALTTDPDFLKKKVT